MNDILIRRAGLDDAAAFARVMSEPDVYSGLLQLPYPNEERWRARLSDNSAEDLVLVAELDGQVVGTSGLHPVGRSQRRRHAMSLGISVTPSAQGRGVGKALMQAMCDYADNWGHVLRLELTVFRDNERAIRLYEKFGFRQEGLFRAYALRAGQYVDALSMARLHPHPPGLPPA